MEGKHVPGEGNRGTIRSTPYGFKSCSVHKRVNMLRGLKIQRMGLIHLQIDNIFLNLAAASSVSLLYACEAVYDRGGAFLHVHKDTTWASRSSRA